VVTLVICIARAKRAAGTLSVADRWNHYEKICSAHGTLFTPDGCGLNMTEQAEAYRKKALECLHAAQGAADSQVKLMYLDLAGKWRDLADQSDVLERQRRLAKN
jgi:hypothetical protein